MFNFVLIPFENESDDAKQMKTDLNFKKTPEIQIRLILMFLSRFPVRLNVFPFKLL